MVTIEWKNRERVPQFSLTASTGPIVGELPPQDFHAAIVGHSQIWGAGSSREEAVGDVLFTAASLLPSIILPPIARQLKNAELGIRTCEGQISNVVVREAEGNISTGKRL